MIGIVRSQDPSIPKKLHFNRKEKEIIERDKEFAENVTISNAQEPSNNENDFSLTFKKKTQECEIILRKNATDFFSNEGSRSDLRSHF